MIAALWMTLPALAQDPVPAPAPPADPATPPATLPGLEGTATPTGPATPDPAASSPEAAGATTPAEGAAPADAPIATPTEPVAEPAADAATPGLPDGAPSEPERELPWMVAFEGGGLAFDDPAYGLFSSNAVIGSIGLRVGVRPAQHLQLRLGWQHANHGSTVQIAVEDTDADFASDHQTLRSAFASHQALAGLRVDAEYMKCLYGYLAGDAMLFAGRIRLDDDPSVRTNPGQVQEWGMGPGLGATAGVELRTPRGSVPVQVGTHLEMGYTWVANIAYGDLGSMQPGGFTVRGGLSTWF